MELEALPSLWAVRRVSLSRRLLWSPPCDWRLFRTATLARARGQFAAWYALTLFPAARLRGCWRTPLPSPLDSFRLAPAVSFTSPTPFPTPLPSVLPSNEVHSDGCWTGNLTLWSGKLPCVGRPPRSVRGRRTASLWRRCWNPRPRHAGVGTDRRPGEGSDRRQDLHQDYGNGPATQERRLACRRDGPCDRHRQASRRLFHLREKQAGP